MCEERSTVRPPSAVASIRVCRNSRRASGSSAASGSSSRSRSGRLARASTRATCDRCPPESVPTRRSSGMPSRASRERASRSSQRALSLRPRVSISATLKRRYSGWSCATKPTRGSTREGWSRGDAPNTRMVPALGAANPMASWRSVVLPAPFGPTSAAIRPAGRCSEQSRNAQERP